MRLRAPARLTASAALALAVTGGLAVTAAPAAHAVGEHSKCTVNWSHGETGTVSKNGWNLRTGPSTGYASRGLLYRGDTVKLLCSRGNWDYTELSKRSKSGLSKGTRGWVRSDGLYQLGG
ncbi:MULTISPECIES: SH3 domain-containing protein [Streptomyces]|uniref:SH3 domain-containing protein n=1 Tax=Streptomyces lancefieldiae TaxID=3075520 RepID=A0ABU3B1F2_9ACTN|nr:SH3 domain-containing protein [Streptomyces sp. DSM 40712]MDT0616283.1 SH3 domain-containing protein [Streptomyces sp. DSM 40712]